MRTLEVEDDDGTHVPGFLSVGSCFWRGVSPRRCDFQEFTYHNLVRASLVLSKTGAWPHPYRVRLQTSDDANPPSAVRRCTPRPIEEREHNLQPSHTQTGANFMAATALYSMLGTLRELGGLVPLYELGTSRIRAELGGMG